MSLIRARKFFKNRFVKNNQAIAATEFALALPVLLLLYVGCFDLTRYIIIQEKLGKTTSAVSDLVSRNATITQTEINNIFSGVPYMMSPYYSASNTEVIIYSVTNYGNGPIVNWVEIGGGTYVGTQTIGNTGSSATLPSGFSLALNEETIICETYYQFSPIIGLNVIGSEVLHKFRFTKPRLGALSSVTSS